MVKVTWDETKNLANQAKHGVSFDEASALFSAGVDYLEIFDDAHSEEEERFIAIGPIARGIVLVVPDRAERGYDAGHQRPLGHEARARPIRGISEARTMTDIPELTPEQLARAIPARVRRRLMAGKFESGDDVAALRRFVGLTQIRFAQAIGISVHTLRNWEQGRRQPEGPALALLRIAARHPKIIRENLESAA